jgi:hypothetical protein
LGQRDFLNINPNTKTTPIFRTRKDAELTAKIYSRIPVLINEAKNQNPWGISFMRMFDMSNDSHLFKTEQDLKELGFKLLGNRFKRGEELWLPLYESKMIWHYDHRFGTYAGVDSRTSTQTPTPSLENHQDPKYLIKPWYWVDKSNMEKKAGSWNYLLGWRDITNSTNERTTISSFSCLSGSGDTLLLINPEHQKAEELTILLSNLNSIIQDWACRQKIPGVHLKYVTFKQLPILPKVVYQDKDVLFIVPRVMELIYTSWDTKAIIDDIWQKSIPGVRFAIEHQSNSNSIQTGGLPWDLPEWAAAYPEIAWEKDKGCPLPPFKWDEERRATLKAELDAYFALLYGLERDELRYILDPQDVYGEDFPGETFRVLKEKDIRRYGEYRTRRLVLEAYDRLRPDWDMESHLQRLQEIWEECQVDLTPKPSLQVNEPKASYGKKKPEKDLGMKGLFD